MPYIVYALCEPVFPLKPGYVGITKAPIKRWTNHLRGGHVRSLLDDWLMSIEGKPFMVMLQKCVRKEDVLDAEVKWIKYFMECGFDLANKYNVKPRESTTNAGGLLSENLEKIRRNRENQIAEILQIIPLDLIKKRGLTHDQRRDRRLLMASLYVKYKSTELIAKCFRVTQPTVCAAIREFRDSHQGTNYDAGDGENMNESPHPSPYIYKM